MGGARYRRLPSAHSLVAGQAVPRPPTNRERVRPERFPLAGTSWPRTTSCPTVGEPGSGRAPVRTSPVSGGPESPSHAPRNRGDEWSSRSRPRVRLRRRRRGRPEAARPKSLRALRMSVTLGRAAWLRAYPTSGPRLHPVPAQSRIGRSLLRCRRRAGSSDCSGNSARFWSSPSLSGAACPGRWEAGQPQTRARFSSRLRGDASENRPRAVTIKWKTRETCECRWKTDA